MVNMTFRPEFLLLLKRKIYIQTFQLNQTTHNDQNSPFFIRGASNEYKEIPPNNKLGRAKENHHRFR